ncbi:DNA repair protein RecO [Temperatibacter marinus]|uniref:DNA repair protein RecO n=1 Tax=Temperatibacter marinus TaxID=1456591 RepID=A0AA52EF77_9PROT|nr:DNA repair protein RecO [Temperatibacter marinus]WND01983.1 DNA repair protein RecO [Temperatibacter marinus]
MDWIDEGIVLNVSKHGENDALLECMTSAHGRHRGFVKSGMSKRQKAILQPGNLLKLSWRSRIEENLGHFRVDPIHSPLGGILSNRATLNCLSAIVSVYGSTLPERETHPELYLALQAYINLLEEEGHGLAILGAGIVKLEAGILSALGYGLNLEECAATGVKDDLIYVSPKSAQAVSKAAGDPYKAKMLPLPTFLLENPANPITHKETLNGLTLTGYFLDRYIWAVYKKGQPSARERVIHQLGQQMRENKTVGEGQT